jgi:hypothetical protein
MGDGVKQARGGAGELVEDTVGLGAPDLRLTRDLVLRPRAVMAAYDAHGATAGGLYPKPVRYWLTLNGFLFLLAGLTGLMERALVTGAGAEGAADIEHLGSHFGKSGPEFVSDLEQWMGLLMLPLWGLFAGGALFLLLRRWSPADDRQDFRQTFTFLNAMTVWGLPLNIAMVLPMDAVLWTGPLSLLLIPMLFAVFGKGRWWTTRRSAWLRGAGLLLAVIVSFIPFLLVFSALTLLAVAFLP